MVKIRLTNRDLYDIYLELSRKVLPKQGLNKDETIAETVDELFCQKCMCM